MRTETLKTSSDNNMYLPSPVSGEFTFSKVVVSSWNLTWMKSKRERYIFLFAEIWKTSPTQRYRKDSMMCRNRAQFAAQPHSQSFECTYVESLVWREKLMSCFDVGLDSVCHTKSVIRKWKKTNCHLQHKWLNHLHYLRHILFDWHKDIT